MKMQKLIRGKNDLLSVFPALAKEWNNKKNGVLRPSDVLPGSHKKVWWKCQKGHEWEAVIRDRTNGKKCPYCSNRKLLPGYNDLATVSPELANEWNYSKNGDLRPKQVKFNANLKVWWKCSQGHEWEAYVFNRNKGHGCPYCSNFSALKGYNDLETINPELAEEWNDEKNGTLKPADFLPGSHKKVWWKCQKGHEWEAEIKSRSAGEKCPYCANKKVLPGYNDLATINPSLTKEWSNKNSISPRDVTDGSEKKVFWVCPLGHDDYLMAISQRKRGQGCPKCAQQSQTSFPEQSLFFYIKQLFPDATNRYLVDNREIDIYIPSKNLGIEYNGFFSHQDKAEKDAAKKNFLQAKGIELITIKEYRDEIECHNADFYIYERTTHKSITTLIISVLARLDNSNTISVDCERDQAQIKSQYIDSIKKNSIAEAMPEIVSEWDYEKNGSIKPEYVSRNSTQKCYWICPNCGHSYLAAPTARYRGTGCPACAGKTVQRGFNDLATRNPELLDEWDYEKNRDLDPGEVFYRTSDEVWWKCKKGHSWKKSVSSRTRNNSSCPYCTGRSVIKGFNDLQTKRPDWAEEWDYSLNEGTPDSIHYNNQTKAVNWICKQCGHKWQHTVCKRGLCPECLRKKTQINVYNAADLTPYGQFENARKFCEHLGIDYRKKQASISNACRRKQRTFMGDYILRHPYDDELNQDT